QAGDIGDRSADSAVRVSLAGGSVPGAERGQGRDDRLDPGRVDLLEHLAQVRVDPGRRADTGRGRGRRGVGGSGLSDEGRSDRSGGRCGEEEAAARTLAGWNVIVFHAL